MFRRSYKTIGFHIAYNVWIFKTFKVKDGDEEENIK